MIDHFGAPWVARDKYELREDARRFETWENSYALRAGLGAAIDYADQIGIDQIHGRVTLLAEEARKALCYDTTCVLQTTLTTGKRCIDMA